MRYYFGGFHPWFTRRDFASLEEEAIAVAEEQFEEWAVNGKLYEKWCERNGRRVFKIPRTKEHYSKLHPFLSVSRDDPDHRVYSTAELLDIQPDS